MINPQKGIDLINNNSIINRILFAVTIFQHPFLMSTENSTTKLINYQRKHSFWRKVFCLFMRLRTIYSYRFDTLTFVLMNVFMVVF
jgi:hypothetical protein